MHRGIIACILVALMAQAMWAEGETAPCGEASGSDTDYTITPCNAQNNEVFNMVVIGDSIAWGAGLNRDEKYSYLTAKWLSEQLSRPVNVKVLAHTGATLEKPETTGIEHQYPDIPSSNPTLFEQADEISNHDYVDLVLVSGGANDVDLKKLNSLDYGFIGSTLDEIQTASWDEIETPMYELLKKLLNECPNAKIIVTGYYSGISKDSKGLTEFYKAFAPESQFPFSDYKKADDPTQLYELATKADTFYEKSNLALNSAVIRANKESGTNRIEFARIVFPSDKSYGTENSWLWKIEGTEGNYRTDDHKYDMRDSLAGTACQQMSLRRVCDKPTESRLAAVGHPNVEGAGEYNRTIVQKISETWPDWLHPMVLDFEVSPTSVTSGESFTIDYKVSSNCSKGLKQVELWRKDELSDWQEIKPPNSLSGRNGPVSGTFKDSPSAPGKYWYGLHVVDNAGNWNDEKNSNTKGQPRSFEPEEVEVKSLQQVTLTLYIHNESSDGPVLVGAEVAGQDTLGSRFSQTSDANGSVVITGSPGIWRFTATKPGYDVNSWPQEITASSTKHAYLFAERPNKALAEEWNRTYGITGDDDLYLFKVTSDGGYIIADDTYDSNAGSGDARLIKIDSDGNEVWRRTFGGEGADLIESAQQTSDGSTIVAGYTQSFGAKFWDAWLFKVDSNGNEVWSRTFGESGNNRAHSVIETNDGGYIMAGATDSFGAGSSDIFLKNDNVWLIKTDSEGNELWNKTFGRLKEAETAKSVQLTSDGGFLISGETYFPDTEIFNIWLIKVDSEGNEVWTKTFVDSDRAHKQISVQPTSDGDFIVNSLTQSLGNGDLDAWVIKVDSRGNERWNRTFGGTYVDVINTVRQTTDGGYIMAGWTFSFAVDGNYAWLIKIDPNGNEIWNRTISDSASGPTLSLGVNSVLPTPDGSYILTATKNSGEDALLIKTDSEGQEIWRTKFGSNASDEEVFSINPTPDGSYILEGYRFSNDGGRGDIWLVKVAPE